MKTLILITISFLFLMTGCSDNIEFSKHSSSSGSGHGGGGDDPGGDSDQSDGIDDSVDLTDPMHSNIRRQTTNLRVIHPKNKVDILFVIDNSGSMALEQTKISRRFNNFINQIRGLDWHIAITTTDPGIYEQGAGRSPWGDGQLIPFSNGHYYLSSSMNLGEVQRLFSENIKRNEEGSSEEKGIYATYRTLERAVTGKTGMDIQIARFLRHDSAFAVVVVSDEDESPDFYSAKSDPDNLIDYVERVFGSGKVFQFHSIIAYTRACLDGEGDSYGYKYRELSIKTGGIVGSICFNDYSAILSRIGREVFNLNKIYKLDCRPQDANNNGVIDMKIIAKNPSSTIPPYTIEEESITFDRGLSQGEYELTYHCLK